MENNTLPRRYVFGLLGLGALHVLYFGISSAQGARKFADLIIANVSWSIDNGATWSVNPIAAGSQVLFRGTVQNIGARHVKTAFRLAFRINGSTVSRVDTTGLKAGATKVMVADGGPDGNAYWEASQSGTFTMAAVVDAQSAVAESTEKNNTRTTSIAVEAAAPLPVANDDIASTPKDTPVIIDVLANDTPGEPGQQLFVGSVQSPTTQGGIAVITADRKAVRYTPPTGFQGEDEFTYEVVTS